MWDEEDGFFYDVLRYTEGGGMRLKVRSLVGLLPLCATTVYSAEVLERLPGLAARAQALLADRPKLLKNISPPERVGVHGRRMLAILDERKLRRVLARMLDPNEFLGAHGIRSLSRYHLDHPYVLQMGGAEHRVSYLPAESDSGLFGGNSNWRGPIWMPINALIVRALLHLYAFYGNDLKVECPTGSGRMMTLFEVSRDLVGRLAGVFLRDERGLRPVYGGTQKFQTDPHWRDHLLFHEYFHGDNGAGLGASHQTGWTGLIAALLMLFEGLDADQILNEGFGVILS
jgi:hypothetical protein